MHMLEYCCKIPKVRTLHHNIRTLQKSHNITFSIPPITLIVFYLFFVFLIIFLLNISFDLNPKL